jgi:hypothetical protein
MEGNEGWSDPASHLPMPRLVKSPLTPSSHLLMQEGPLTPTSHLPMPRWAENPRRGQTPSRPRHRPSQTATGAAARSL